MENKTPAYHWLWPAAGMSRSDRRRWLLAFVARPYR